MCGLIRNSKRNIAVASSHNYTEEKVRKALDFVAHANRRTTSIEDYLNMYNYLKGTDEKIIGCKPCAQAKYINGVENYAKYGYLVLLNQGIDCAEKHLEEKKAEEPIENLEERIKGLVDEKEIIQEDTLLEENTEKDAEKEIQSENTHSEVTEKKSIKKKNTKKK